MAEKFKLDSHALQAALEGEGSADLGVVAPHDDADELHQAIAAALEAGIVKPPAGLTILIYPLSLSETDVALVTVLSLTYPTIQIVGGLGQIGKMVPHGLRNGEDDAGASVAIVEAALYEADRAIPQIRALEAIVKQSECAGAVAP